MPLAVIAGMPNNKAREFKHRIDGSSTYGAWGLTWLPSRRNQAGLRIVWDDVMDIADASDASGVHILAYDKALSGRSRYEEEIRFRHRLVWLDHSRLYGEGRDEWWTQIKEKLLVEDSWRESVRPPDRRHALILPRGTFASRRDPWTTAQRAETPRAVDRAQSEINTFEEAYRRQGRWRDEHGQLFDSGGPEHGVAPENRRWKFTYHLSPGFHFDVQHEAGREFTVIDANGDDHSFREYTNVDSHGYVRGGQ